MAVQLRIVRKRLEITLEQRAALTRPFCFQGAPGRVMSSPTGKHQLSLAVPY